MGIALLDENCLTDLTAAWPQHVQGMETSAPGVRLAALSGFRGGSMQMVL